jgi:ParB/RepB/Spo0J family partition protein
MAFLVKGQRVNLSEIWVDRENRQRKVVDPEHVQALADSIKRLGGLINPVVLQKKQNPNGPEVYELKAGECRLEAHKLLGLAEIDARFNNESDPQYMQALELEENLKRQELPWQDRCLAELRLHEAYCAIQPGWAAGRTAEALGIDPTILSRDLTLAEEIRKGNESVIKAEKISHANTALRREAGREAEVISALLFDSKPQAKPAINSSHETNGVAEISLEEIITPSKPVLCVDAIEWMKTYKGPKFNFIHCDFPYGVGMHKTGQASKALDNYEDSPDIYFNLLETFVANYRNFGATMSHVMFWYSDKFRERTIELLWDIPGAKVFEYPLVWLKSDGKGIVSDALHRPRHVYETALMVSVGERQIRKVVNDAISHPTDAARSHLSRKPPGVLGHFFSMFVDSETRLLDPTCGSGSALQVGRGMGAQTVLGLERDQKIIDEILI